MKADTDNDLDPKVGRFTNFQESVMGRILAKLGNDHPNKVIFLLAVIITTVRFYNFGHWFTFDADQEAFSFLVKTIVVDHHPLLIGMPTSVGGMFIGPLFVYLLSPFYLAFQMQPVAQVFFTGLNSLALLFSIGFVARKIYSFKTGVLATVLYGGSWLLTVFDRTFWNPDLIPLTILWSTYLLWKYFLDFPRRRFLLLATIVMSFMFHLHFVSLPGYVFFVASWFLILIMKKKLDLLGAAILMGIPLISLSPLILFDFRHQFLISHNLVNFLIHGANASDTIIKPLSSFERIEILLSILGTSIYNHPSVFVEGLTGVFLLGRLIKLIRAVKPGSSPKLFFETLFFLLLGILFLVFLKSNTPILPYYFLIIFPSLIIIVADSVEWLTRGRIIWQAAILCLFLIVNLPEIWSTRTDLNLENKQAVVQKIIADTGAKTFKVDFITNPGLKTGFDYLFWVNGKQLIEDQTIETENSYKIVVPFRLVPRSEIKTFVGPYGIIKK